MPYALLNSAMLYTNTLQLPVYISSECQEATRKLACGIAFMAPERQNATEVVAVLGGSLYMPSFPHRAVCMSYNAACAEFIAVAAATTNVNLTQVR
jgi:hypothetical protein